MKIYLIGGLGADYRVFRDMRIEGWDLDVLEWIEPQKGEDISAYALRLSEQIDTSRDVYLLGVSLGGMMVLEIAQHINYKQIILISSIKDAAELPKRYRLIGKMQLLKLVNGRLLKRLSPLGLNYFFGVRSKMDRELIKAIVGDTDERFLIWALRQIVHWKGVPEMKNVCHIHGTRDKLFPVRHLKKYIRLEGGGHFMIVTHARAINQLVEDILSCQEH